MEPIRFSRLKRIARSPAHYVGAVEPTGASLRMGSAVHAAAFGGPRVVLYEKRRAGKEWDAFLRDNEDAIILNEREHANVIGMAKSLRANDHAVRLCSRADLRREETLFWDFAGMPCRGTPDVFCADWIVELKTTRFGEPHWFTKEALRRAYHAQLSWYRHGVLRSTGHEPQSAYVVAVESSPPYPVSVLRLTERALERGERLWRLWFEQLMVCEQSQHWPGYTEAIVDLDIPDDDELDLTFGEDAA